MLGYTEEELDRYFAEHMEAHRQVLGLSAEAYRAELRRLYNGYRFFKWQGDKVYNPVSINLTMANRHPQFELHRGNSLNPHDIDTIDIIGSIDMIGTNPPLQT